jgi:hypothetical protein
VPWSSGLAALDSDLVIRNKKALRHKAHRHHSTSLGADIGTQRKNKLKKKSEDIILVFLLLGWIFGQNSKRLDNCQSRNIKRLLYFLAGVANPSIADSTKIYHLKFERVKN